MTLESRISELTRQYRPLAIEILKETIRVPADYVDRPVDEGGDPLCGTSNHEGPRVEYLRRTLVEISMPTAVTKHMMTRKTTPTSVTQKSEFARLSRPSR